VGKYYSRAVAIVAVGFLLMWLGLVGSAWAGQGGAGASCKTADDCAPMLQCRSIHGNNVCDFRRMPDAPGTPPQPNFERCHVDADCDPGWTCGGAGHPEPDQ
jgi:hypothetical protein